MSTWNLNLHAGDGWQSWLYYQRNFRGGLSLHQTGFVDLHETFGLGLAESSVFIDLRWRMCMLGSRSMRITYIRSCGRVIPASWIWSLAFDTIDGNNWLLVQRRDMAMQALGRRSRRQTHNRITMGLHCDVKFHLPLPFHLRPRRMRVFALYEQKFIRRSLIQRFSLLVYFCI